MGRQFNTGRTHFPSGHIPWNKGKKGLVTAWNKGIKNPDWQGEKNPRWNPNKDFGNSVFCTLCGKEFIRKPNTKGKFCSKDCYWKDLVGKKNDSKTKFKEGNIPYNEGLPEDQQPGWKGDKVQYDALHDWVRKHLGKPSKCDFCGTTEAKRFEWANKTGEYKRELSDWLRLCKSCHVIYDKKRKR